MGPYIAAFMSSQDLGVVDISSDEEYASGISGGKSREVEIDRITQALLQIKGSSGSNISVLIFCFLKCI